MYSYVNRVVGPAAAVCHSTHNNNVHTLDALVGAARVNGKVVVMSNS